MIVKLVVFAFYIAMLVAFAVRARTRTHDIEDYYVGGRSVPTLFVVLSFFATFVSTNSFIGHAGKSYEHGVSWFLVGGVLVLFALIAWKWIAPRFRERAGDLGSVTPSDLFSRHYRSRPAGTMAAVIILVDSVFFMSAVLLGASESLAALLGISFWPALVAVFAVQLTYTSVGGYLADVWSDSVQAVILMVGALLLPAAVISHAGGWGAMWTQLRALDSAAAGPHESLTRLTLAGPLIAIVGVGLSGGLKMVADPRQLSRFYALRDAKAARSGTWLIVLLVAATYACLLPLGLFARALGAPVGPTGTDAIVPWLLGDAQVLGPVAGAVLLTALLAAAMSTIDSVLLVAAASLQRDVLSPSDFGDRDAGVRAARKIVIAYSVAPLLVAVLSRANPHAGLGIVELTVFAGALYAGAFLPGLAGILYWPWANATGAMAAMVAGAFATGVWRFAVLPRWESLQSIHEVYVGLAAGMVALVAGSRASRRRRVS